MSSDFEKRLRAVEKKIRVKPGADTFRILRIGGGLPGPINFAYAGSLRWERETNEELEAFAQRCAIAAREAGEMSLNVGGLPRGDEYAKYNGDFDAFWEAECAPYYSEIPPEEAPGFVRRKSEW